MNIDRKQVILWIKKRIYRDKQVIIPVLWSLVPRRANYGCFSAKSKSNKYAQYQTALTGFRNLGVLSVHVDMLRFLRYLEQWKTDFTTCCYLQSLHLKPWKTLKTTSNPQPTKEMRTKTLLLTIVQTVDQRSRTE
jgi:hypothetical protein